MLIPRCPARFGLTAVALAALLTACGGGDDDEGDNGGGTPPPDDTPVACSVNSAATLAFEERRLETPLPFEGTDVVGTDQTPLATRILTAAGFQNFGPEFAAGLCDANGQTTIQSYDEAVEHVRAKGQALWRAAVDRVQGRRTATAGETLPQSDDRMLYWARVQMTKALRQWSPSWNPTAEQMETLQWELERASRGQYDIDLPAGNAASGAMYRRMIVSGFDVFTLGTPGTPSRGLRNGNPSGATALELDGREFNLRDGTVLRIETYVLPVSYNPFHLGMQEDTLGPWFRPGPQQVDASLTVSQGGANTFWLEQWNGRFHGSSAGNDGIVYCPSGNRLPNVVLPIGTVTTPGSDPISLEASGCNIYPVERWLGYNAKAAWVKDFPPQFVAASLPIPAMVLGNTQAGVVRPPGVESLGTEGFNVTWHTNYTYFPNCVDPATVTVPSNDVMNALPDISTLTPPDPAWCARSGGGGDYLSNESAYRNTLLRDVFGLDIPAGHIHVPVMNNYFNPEVGGQPRDDNAITDARFEAYRTAIVQQTKNLILIVGESLAFR